MIIVAELLRCNISTRVTGVKVCSLDIQMTKAHFSFRRQIEYMC